MFRFKVLFLAVFVAALAQLILLFIKNDPLASYTMDEGALFFGSKMEIEENNGIKVTELVEVRAAGENIKYGIGRVLPNYYITPDRERRTLEYTILSAKRDGVPIEFVESEHDWGTRVQLWRGEDVLESGTHQFVTAYKVFGQLRATADGLTMRRYVTGRWIYPVLRTQLVLVFPPSAAPESIRVQPYAILSHDRKKSETSIEGFEVKHLDPLTVEVVRERPLYPDDQIVLDAFFKKRSRL